MSAHVASLHPHHQLAAGTSAMRAAAARSGSGSGGGNGGSHDLAILSAETYVDPGLSFLPSPPSSGPNNNKKPSNTSNGSHTESTSSSSRKRLKRASPEGGDRDGDEEEKKRSRGRPRLDIKDETAADRRRTQIRLAQRAYRNRKENAIQTLERRVQELRDTNEEMSNAFMRLHDFAVNNGLVDQAPEFGRQLRSTTEKFLTLARMSSEENSKLDEGEGGGSPDKQNSDVESSLTSSNKNKSNNNNIIHGPKPVVITPPPDTSSMSSLLESKGDQVYGGFIVTHEPVIDDLLSSSAENMSFSLDPPTTTAATTNHHHPGINTSASMPDLDLQEYDMSSGDMEIITQPTLENASFPMFSFDLPGSSSFPTATSTIPLDLTSPSGLSSVNSEFNNFNTFTGTLFPSLSAPTSYASQEATFGRRLQRTGIERALVLITMPNPPAKRFNRVFGFCLMLESKEAIYKRLMRGIQRTVGETLNNWHFPFFNLGGAGTHHAQLQLANSGGGGGGGGERGHEQERMRMRMGNEGTIDVMKPLVSNGGFNMGPFDSTISEVSDKLLDKDMRVNPSFIPGDGSGVDRGVTGGDPSGRGLFGGEYFDCDEVEMYLRQRGVVIPPAADFITAEVEVGNFWNGDGRSDPTFASSSSSSSSPSSGSGSGLGSSPGLDDWAMGMGMGMGAVDPMLQLTGTGTGTGTPSDDNNGGNGSGPSPRGRTSTPIQTQTTSSRKMVTVDINLLVYELIERTVCLGRTPGIKQEDINVAFWKASQVLA